MAQEGFDSEKGRRGALIVVEGLDRAGKSSQCELLLHNLQTLGHQAKYIRFPGTQNSLFWAMKNFVASWRSRLANSPPQIEIHLLESS